MGSWSYAESFMKGCCQLQAKVCARITGYPLVQACPGKSVVRWTDRPAMTIAVDLGRKATKQNKIKTKKKLSYSQLVSHSSLQGSHLWPQNFSSLSQSVWHSEAMDHQYMYKSRAIRPSTSLGQILIYYLTCSTAATASVSVIYAPVFCIHCSPTYGDGRG